MTENLPAISERGEDILRERVRGVSVRALARQHKCSIDAINFVLDSMIERVTEAWKLRQIGVECERLDAMLEKFLRRALDENDAVCGSLALKVIERRCHLLALDAIRQQDPIQLQLQVSPPQSNLDRILKALDRIRSQHHGNGSDAIADGSVAPSDPPAREH